MPKFHLNIKYNLPMIIFVAAFGAVATLGLKHGRKPSESPADNLPSSAVERHQMTTIEDVSDAAAPALVSDTAALSASAPLKASATDLAQARVLDEILLSHNDNDPRLDQELRHLSPAAKQLFRGRYQAIATEKRNERGTVVFVMGREINSHEDIAFLRQVLNEPPCRSLTSCDREDTGSVAPEDRHYEGTNETTLAYPQIVALKSLENYLHSPSRTPELTASALEELEAAKRSPVRKVASLAEEISRRYHAKNGG